MVTKRAVNAQKLIEAIEDGDVDEVHAILKQRPRLANGSGNKGERPILVAAYNLDLKIMTVLLDEFNADVHAKDSRGFNVIENAAFGFTAQAKSKGYKDVTHNKYCKILKLLHDKHGCQTKASGE